MHDIDEKKYRPYRFLDTPPFYYSQHYARLYNCDLAVPNGVGIGNIICFTALVEAYARKLGKCLTILTSPFKPIVGTVENELPYPFWENNPYIGKIVNADDIDPQIMEKVVLEQDNYCQFSHVIENLCANFKVKPIKLKGSLFLSSSEMKWAIEVLSKFKRPICCMHISGTSSPTPGHQWYIDEWLAIIDILKKDMTFIQLDKHDYDHKETGVFNPITTLREAMALIWASDSFIGFDSGLAHIATSFEKPSIVLWDTVRKAKLEEFKQEGFSSAMMLRWAYPQNINLSILGEKGHEIRDYCIKFLRSTINSFYG